MLEWTKDYEKRMNDLEKAYIDNYNSIKEKLAQNVVQLHEYSLHDSVVKSSGEKIRSYANYNFRLQWYFQ